jgi:hypothetical protein
VRKLWIGFCVLMLAAGCSSSSKGSSTPTTKASPSGPTTTIDPNLVPNVIPYVVGERIGLPNNWIIGVTKVHRPYTQTGLALLPSGRQYVAVDISMNYQGSATQTVKAADLFTMVDGNRDLHKPANAPTPNGIDGTYKAGTTRSGRLVYAVPPKVRLALAMEGPKIGTQRSIFTIDPPTVPAG